MRWVAVCVAAAALVGVAVGYVGGRHAAHGTDGKDTITDYQIRTRVEVDTLTVIRPLPYLVYMVTGDTIRTDSCAHVREVAEYSDSSYYARVSGVEPRLDEIRVYPKTVYRTETVTQTVAQKERRWCVGVTGGVGVTQKGVLPFVGVGVMWRVWGW